MKGFKATITDLSAINRALGTNFCGILGMDRLASSVLVLDPDESLVTIGDILVGDGEPLPLSFDKWNIPQIRLRVGRKDTLAVIDTGAICSLIVDEKVSVSVEPLNQYNVAGSSLVDISGESRSLSGVRCQSVTIGKTTMLGVSAYAADESRLGLFFLARWKWSFDFAKRRVVITPSRFMKSADHADFYGLHLREKNGKSIVSNVVKSSLSDKAGLREGDVIVAISNYEGTDLTSAVISRELGYLRLAPKRIVLLRENKRVELVLPLE